MTTPGAPTEDAWWPFSLGRGAPGILLTHASQDSWEQAHTWAKAMVTSPVPAGERAGLFEGAPAVAFALHVANHPAYTPALATVDQASLHLIEQRLESADQRLSSGGLPELGEFDLINGLTGLGAYLLTLHPASALLRDVLTYLVNLTHPIHTQHGTLPGWWTPHSPSDHPDPAFDGGHGNLGLAHGITGPLALLSSTLLWGITVPGQRESIVRILHWVDTWQQEQEERAWWPEWVTHPEHTTGTTRRTHPGRPSWCYGTPGISWAQHLAGRALHDHERRRKAELALHGCATDPAQQAHLSSPGLCHGRAGLHLILDRIAEHADLPQLRHPLPRPGPASAVSGPGLLEGQAGLDLAHTNHATWANCLLVGPTPLPQRPDTARS